MSLKLPQSFSFFGGGSWFDDKKSSSSKKAELSPSFKIQTDKEVYRPGDLITATLEIGNPRISKEINEAEPFSNESCSLLVDNLAFEVKGIEKLDSQWFYIQKPLPGSKQRRGALFSNSVQMDIYWKEEDADSGWVQANEFSDELEEGYDSSRDELSSVSSFTPARGNIDLSIRKSLSSQSISARVSSNEYQYAHGERSSHPSYMPLPQFSVAEDIDSPEERAWSR